MAEIDNFYLNENDRLGGVPRRGSDEIVPMGRLEDGTYVCFSDASSFIIVGRFRLGSPVPDLVSFSA